MRVIAGSARRLPLKALKGSETRPTLDRVKETLFNILAPCIFDSIFLDLFAGSGAIGIEALSRGAKEAVFVENNPRAMACVKENLQFTKLSHKACTVTKDALTALYQLEGEKIFDYIYIDPPYASGMEKAVLEYLANSRLVYEDTVIIVEAPKSTDFSYVEDLGFVVTREKDYKTNRHVFIEKAGKVQIC